MKNLKILSPEALLVTLIAAEMLIAIGVGTAEAASSEVLMKGQLVSEKCVEKGLLSACAT